MKFSQNFIKYQKSPLLKMSSIHIVGKAPILFNLKLKMKIRKEMAWAFKLIWVKMTTKKNRNKKKHIWHGPLN